MKTEHLSETELAGIAKDLRIAAGKSRAQAARELKVSRPAIAQAEDNPEKSFSQLRRRIIEQYSDWEVQGPEYRLEKK